MTNHKAARGDEGDPSVDPELARKLQLVLSRVAERYDPAQPSNTRDRRPTRWVSVAAAAILVVGVAGVAVIATRPGNDNGPAGPVVLPSAAGSAPEHAQLPSGNLLYPSVVVDGDVPELQVAGLQAGPRALLRAPDGSLYRVAAGQPFDTPADAKPAGPTRDVNGHQVVADTDDQGSVGYSWVDGCVRTSVITGNDGDTWDSTRLDLLGSLEAAGDTVTLTLPHGWTVVDEGPNAAVIQLVYDFVLDGETHRLVLGQTEGASIAAFPGMSIGSLEPVTLRDGTPAWFERDGVPASRLAFSRDDVAIWLWGEAGTGADVLVAAAAQLAPNPSAWTSLLGPSEPVATSSTTPTFTPGGCDNPTLTIVSPD